MAAPDLFSSFSYREHAPSPALARSVACYWTIDAKRAPGHRVLPDGCMDILFDLSSPAADVHALIIGVMTTAIVTEPAARTHILGVRFSPGEAFAFVDVLAKESKDRVLSLEDAWGRDAGDLHAQLLAADDVEARIAILDRALLAHRRTSGDPRLRGAIAAIRAARGAVRVDVLAARAGIGERQLERLFDERVGVGPKSLAKVARMQALLDAIASGSRAWATLATELGWVDQSHLARDLRSLAGLTPTELARSYGMSDSSNPPHGPLATKKE